MGAGPPCRRAVPKSFPTASRLAHTRACPIVVQRCLRAFLVCRGGSRYLTLHVSNVAAYSNGVANGNPIVQAIGIGAKLRLREWLIDSLPDGTKTVALCAIAIGAMTTSEPTVVPALASTVPAPRDGQDLRHIGRKRRLAIDYLTELALTAAQNVQVLLIPSMENAASCFMLDLLLRFRKLARHARLSFSKSCFVRPVSNADLANRQALAARHRNPP